MIDSMSSTKDVDFGAYATPDPFEGRIINVIETKKDVNSHQKLKIYINQKRLPQSKRDIK